jgi:hypothetical protein
VFAVIITMDFVTAALAFWVLKPMRRRYLEQSHRVGLPAAAAGILARSCK